MVRVAEYRWLDELECCRTCAMREAKECGDGAGCLVDGQIVVDAQDVCVRYGEVRG